MTENWPAMTRKVWPRSRLLSRASTWSLGAAEALIGLGVGPSLSSIQTQVTGGTPVSIGFSGFRAEDALRLNQTGMRAGSFREKSQRLELGDLEWLAAADVGAGELVVTPDHIGLGLGKSRAIALIGVAGNLRTLAAHHPSDFVLGGLAAFGAGQVVVA